MSDYECIKGGYTDTTGSKYNIGSYVSTNANYNPSTVEYCQLSYIGATSSSESTTSSTAFKAGIASGASALFRILLAILSWYLKSKGIKIPEPFNAWFPGLGAEDNDESETKSPGNRIFSFCCGIPPCFDNGGMTACFKDLKLQSLASACERVTSFCNNLTTSCNTLASSCNKLTSSCNNLKSSEGRSACCNCEVGSCFVKGEGTIRASQERGSFSCCNQERGACSCCEEGIMKKLLPCLKKGPTVPDYTPYTPTSPPTKKAEIVFVIRRDLLK